MSEATVNRKNKKKQKIFQDSCKSKYAKIKTKPREIQKTKNTIARPMSVQAGELGSAILFFFVFFVCFFCFFGFTSRNPTKTKKQNCKTYVGTSWWVRVCNFVFFCSFCFFVFFGFTWRNPKKTKKRKCKTYVGTSWWVRVCNFVFFLFFLFFLVVLVLPREIQKNQKKTKLQDLCRYKLVS